MTAFNEIVVLECQIYSKCKWNVNNHYDVGLMIQEKLSRSLDSRKPGFLVFKSITINHLWIVLRSWSK